MKILTKFGALLRAGIRKSNESGTESNAIRFYQQEIVEAQTTLIQRREVIAVMIATRNELEDEIQSLRGRISSKEQQVLTLPESKRSEDLMQLAVQDIATIQDHLDDIQQRHVSVCRKINSEEITLRRLLSEMNEHRRDLKLMASQV